MNRRHFLASIASATAFAAVARARSQTASDRPPLRVAVIGCGWFGGINLQSFQGQDQPIRVVALCDPNRRALDTLLTQVAAVQAEVPRTYAHFESLLADCAVDVAIIATPDHWHALPAIAAMQAGADLYLEKPIGVDVVEGEAMVAAARKYQCVVQVNLQRRSNPLFHEARERYVDSGRLGRIGRVEALCSLHRQPPDPAAACEPPAHLDYERWTGPAPLRPFHPEIESRGWRSYREYGNGVIGDMGVHLLDFARWMLRLQWPDTIASHGGTFVEPAGHATTDDTQLSVFRFPQGDLIWDQRTWGAPPSPPRHWTDQWTVRFIGQHGTLSTTLFGYEFIPADGRDAEGANLLARGGDWRQLDFSAWFDAFLEVQRRHVGDFLKARRDRSRPAASIEEGHISSACCCLANLAQELGRPLAYDPVSRAIRNDREASQRLARPYRSPWVHPLPERV